jgi:dipeptidase E
MNLLLTSGGITNKSIEKALFDLVGKKPEDTSAVFVLTASNMEKGDKTWLIDDLVYLKKQNFKSIDITDIPAVQENIWKPKFEEADIIFFEGGNEYYLMEWIDKSGLKSVMPEFLKNKVYVGVSAGSIVAGKNLDVKIMQTAYGEDFDKNQNMACMGLVNFNFFPHLNSYYFKKVREDLMKELAKEIQEKVYVLDDNSALKVVDGKVEVISEGKWFLINA